ncbi:vomeronasal type-2 receptor 26-like [Eleutherodactylus coqui]|uniref:vomeronasal type-2 receptor 26-like n=1 Tax=Eleutherodactylus coqui TaxID=57060 RepID=UPI003461FD3C
MTAEGNGKPPAKTACLHEGNLSLPTLDLRQAHTKDVTPVLWRFLPVVYSTVAPVLRRHDLDVYYKEGDLMIGGIIQDEVCGSNDIRMYHSAPSRRRTSVSQAASLSLHIAASRTGPSFVKVATMPEMGRQISYGTMSPVFRAAQEFPSFYQAAANELSETHAIVQLVKYFGWKWVGILVSDDDTGQIAAEAFKTEILSSGGCVAFLILFKLNPYVFPEFMPKTIETINKSSVNVTVAFLSMSFMEMFFQVFSAHKLKAKIWITSSHFTRVYALQCLHTKTTFNGTLSLAAHQGQIPGFKDYFYSIKPIKYPDNKLLREIWPNLVPCTNYDDRSEYLPKCIGNETLDDKLVSLFDIFDFRTSYTLYTMIYTLAHSLHDMYATSKSKSLLTIFQHWRKVDGTSTDLPCAIGGIKEYKLSISTEMVRKHLANLNDFKSQGPDALYPRILKEAVEVPPSLCNAPCKPGYRKAKREGEPSCCYDCVQCAKGEMSNATDSQRCLKCSSYENSNIDRTRCVLKDVSFLSYGDILGATLTSLSLIFSILTSLILGIFWKYQETSIVKANNRNLSYILLISITLCFMCTLLFVGRPSSIRCLLRQATFGVVFTVSVSSVLGKTLTVIIAFKATQPGSRIKTLLGTKLSITLVFLCSMGEILLSAIWIMFCPPYLDVDTEMDTILLLCNEGSSTFFFLEIGYIGMLALICLGAAFLAKDFPDRFNEAKNISFSILIFCSVWVTFVPTYLSVKGKNMVAVEVFAILTSSAGLLSFIFLPKCYVILKRYPRK